MFIEFIIQPGKMQICTAHSVRPSGYFSFRLGPARTRPGPVSLAARPETRQALFARGDNLCYLMPAKQRTESRNRSIARPPSSVLAAEPMASGSVLVT